MYIYYKHIHNLRTPNLKMTLLNWHFDSKKQTTWYFPYVTISYSIILMLYKLTIF